MAIGRERVLRHFIKRLHQFDPEIFQKVIEMPPVHIAHNKKDKDKLMKFEEDFHEFITVSPHTDGGFKISVLGLLSSFARILCNKPVVVTVNTETQEIDNIDVLSDREVKELNGEER